jgi:exodeoxyribonuclease-3
MPTKLKICSWNVNGIRAVVKNGFVDWLKEEKPDVVGLQEIKINDASKEKVKFSAQGGPASGWDFAGYNEYWHHAERPGYSGTAVLSRVDPLSVVRGFDNKDDDEGRVITLEFDNFYFVNTYFPNAQHELTRLGFKEEFNKKWLAYIKNLEKKKPVVTCGDFNVAHEEIDLARPKDNVGNAGFTKEERAWFTKFLGYGLIDTFRFIKGEKIQYSWWSYRMMARAKNIGWRIDYFLVSEKLKTKIKDAFIRDTVLGSDHAPVGIVLEI